MEVKTRQNTATRGKGDDEEVEKHIIWLDSDALSVEKHIWLDQDALLDMCVDVGVFVCRR